MFFRSKINDEKRRAGSLPDFGKGCSLYFTPWNDIVGIRQVVCETAVKFCFLRLRQWRRGASGNDAVPDRLNQFDLLVDAEPHLLAARVACSWPQAPFKTDEAILTRFATHVEPVCRKSRGETGDFRRRAAFKFSPEIIDRSSPAYSCVRPVKAGRENRNPSLTRVECYKARPRFPAIQECPCCDSARNSLPDRNSPVNSSAVSASEK